MQAIAGQTRQKVQDAANHFAATKGAIIRSGQHDAQLGQLRIEGVEQMASALFQMWVDLIKQRNGHVARGDIAFVSSKIDQLVSSQKANLRRVFAEQGGGVVSSLVQQADMRMH